MTKKNPLLTRRERDVLAALCRPSLRGEAFTEPASVREVAETLGVSDAAIKQHLLHLYDKFELFEGGDNRRLRLANMAVAAGAVSPADFGGSPAEPGVTGALALGREAVALRNWQRAYEQLSAAESGGSLAVSDLEALAEAALWIGKHEESIAARQRAYAIHIKDGNARRSAAVALDLVINHLARLQIAVASGWVAKAKRHLQTEEACVEMGVLALTECLFAQAGGQVEEGLKLAKQGFEIGERFGNSDVRSLGLVLQGFSLAQMGRLDEAAPFFDEAMASAVAGELGPLATGIVYCRTICASLEAFDFRRALEWTDAVERVSSDSCMSGFSGDCRTHHAAIRVFKGEWVEGENEARLAVSESERFDLAHAALARYETGVVRLRCGDFDGAEALFKSALECGVNPQPGYALLLLARGDVPAAELSIRSAIEEAGVSDLRKVRLLPARVEIAYVVGDSDAVQIAADELARIADKFRTSALRGHADTARGIVAAMNGTPASALDLLRGACRRWLELGAPYEAACARVKLGSVLMDLGDAAAARLEFDAALRAFERLGALPDVRKAQELLSAITA